MPLVHCGRIEKSPGRSAAQEESGNHVLKFCSSGSIGKAMVSVLAHCYHVSFISVMIVNMKSDVTELPIHQLDITHQQGIIPHNVIICHSCI